VGEGVCEFLLEIEELQTFASYVFINSDLLSRGTPGDTYFLNASGFFPAVPNIGISERGDCYMNSSFDPIVYRTDFNRRNCSVPMTVDGVSYRMFIAVNGRIPGPTLIVDDGSIMKVTVVNRLVSEAVTIHWHGMHQKGTPWMDGVGFISQPPIGAGASFDYLFTATPAGTHWYHSHVGAQRTDGLFGALIVREKDNFFRDEVTPKIRKGLPLEEHQVIYDVPGSHTMTLLDFQREASLDLFVKIHSTLGFYPNNPIGEVPSRGSALYNPRTRSSDDVEVGPVPYWSGLINGRGMYDFPNGTSSLAPLSIFKVTRDSAYRFRVIGAQSLFAYIFSIDNHKLRVIATDGHFVNPEPVDYIVVHSGERYDFIVDTFEDTERLFWIRAETLEQPGLTDRQHSARAVLYYANANAPDELDWRNGYSNVNSTRHSCTVTAQCKVLNCPFSNASSENMNCISITDLRSLFIQEQATLPRFVNTTDCEDCLQFFNFGFEGVSLTSAINGRNFQLPITPYQTNCGQYDLDVQSTNDTCSNKPLPDSNRDLEVGKCINVVRIARSETFSTDSEPKTVVMIFSAVGLDGLGNFSHPIHLHGHSFHVLHVGYGEYNADGSLNASLPSPDVTCNGDNVCANPSWADRTQLSNYIREAAGIDGRINNSQVRKDTVMVPAGGYVVIAFQADNPGYWFLHCHIEVHQLEGMGVLIEEYPYTQHRKEPDGINVHGNFRWSVSEFTDFVGEGATCEAAGGNRASFLTVLAVGVLMLLMTGV
jgi:FtsP/CotA-like multicopper oxidase with cupredoxin domain